MNMVIVIEKLSMKNKEKETKKRLDCEFIRINPDESNFSINRAINKTHRYINKSTRELIKELTKKETKNICYR